MVPHPKKNQAKNDFFSISISAKQEKIDLKVSKKIASPSKREVASKNICFLISIASKQEKRVNKNLAPPPIKSPSKKKFQIFWLALCALWVSEHTPRCLHIFNKITIWSILGANFQFAPKFRALPRF